MQDLSELAARTTSTLWDAATQAGLLTNAAPAPGFWPAAPDVLSRQAAVVLAAFGRPATGRPVSDMAAGVTASAGRVPREGVVEDAAFFTPAQATFLRHALACVLVNPAAPAAAWEWLARTCSPGALGLPLDWATVRAWRWTVLPVWLAGENSSAVASASRVLLGASPVGDATGSPSCPWSAPAEALLDADALTALDVAANLALDHAAADSAPGWRPAAGNAPSERQAAEDGRAERQAVFCLPLGQPLANGARRINGGSLGLPLYLGWRSLLAGSSPPAGLAASGVLAPDGALRATLGVLAKAKQAEQEKYAAFLYPDAALCGGDASAGSKLARLELLPTPDLGTAWLLWSAHVPGHGQDMLSVLAERARPARLAMRFHLLPEPISGWLAASGLLAQGVRDLLDDRSALEAVTKALFRLDDCRGHQIAVKAILETADEAVVRDIAAKGWPNLAYDFCQLHLKYNNHRGDVQATRPWGSMSQELKPFLGDENADLQSAQSDLRVFITDAHNCYQFDPDACQRLEDELADILAVKRDAYARRRQHNPAAKPTDCFLGKFHGTLAQHFGFCGPDWLGDTEEHCRLTSMYFGDGENKEVIKDWLRQAAYIVFALLDANQTERARDALLSLLKHHGFADMETFSSERYAELDSFQHHVLSRWLADSGRTAPGYAAWGLDSRTFAKMRHPHQLCLYNLGRLAEDPQVRRKLWTCSTRQCLAGGPTMAAMALLPLSALAREGLWPETELADGASHALEAIRRPEMNAAHFAPVLRAAGWRDALAVMAREAPRLFPFNYR